MVPGERTDPELLDALNAIRLGRPVILLDDHDREDEADLVLAARFTTPAWLAFFIREARGLLCVAMEGERLDQLELPMMTPHNKSRQATPFAVSVEAASVLTGISAADRAETIHALLDPASTPADLVSPGHVFPLRAAPGGLRERRGHTEGAVELCRLAGMEPMAVIAEILNPDGSVARGGQVRSFAARHGFPIISIEQLAGRASDSGEESASAATAGPEAITVEAPPRAVALHRAAETRLPTSHGEFRLMAYPSGGQPHLALVMGDPPAGPPPLVRIHSECLTGDILGSRRCDCGPQLDSALAKISAEGRGILIYLRQEGRGIGLMEKLRAYGLQDAGLDTVDANLALGHPVDARDYGIAGAILHDLGLTEVRLLTNNPAKVLGLEGAGIRVVERTPLVVPVDPLTQPYLDAKRDRMGHLLEAS
jgi:3,4-dihydroxy 2-butanone 4-phosphate synthase / GTP cyclohydrolase II